MQRVKRFAGCISNKGYEASSILLRKVYAVIPDEPAGQDDFLRIVDESGEDHLYHQGHFFFVELPEEVKRVLAAA